MIAYYVVKSAKPNLGYSFVKFVNLLSALRQPAFLFHLGQSFAKCLYLQYY